MPGSWPEPFGLVAIEALATGTPVVARRIGALPEIIRDGIDGFFGDDVTAMAFKVDRVADLDREAIRASVIDRFSVERMTDGYEAVYARVLEGGDATRAEADRRVDRTASSPPSGCPPVAPTARTSPPAAERARASARAGARGPRCRRRRGHPRLRA